MEFVPGETLQDRIERKKKIRTDEMLRYAIALAGALEAAGKLGVVHRNVKPSNVLVARGTGEPRLIDFGLAKILRPERGPGLTDATAPLGTIRYMAPEQLRDASAADPRSDLYSLAATMFHALTGKLPYHDRNELELLQAAEDGKPIAFDLSREEDIPQALKNVLACALMRDPGDRHPNATVLLDELRAALAKTPEPAAPLRDQDNTPRTQRLEAGLFTDDHLMTLVGKLGQMSRTGTLQVKSGVRGGSLVFEDGRVIAAQTLSGQRGEEAAYQLLGLFRGEWIFKPGPDHGIAPDAPLETKALVQEALRRRGLYETQSGD
jgi:serine/threonine protein kinase